jgi:hypothetical protein
LAAWILDHDARSHELIARVFDGQPEGLRRDDVLDNITLYWLTNTAVSASRLYWENKLAFFAPKDVAIPGVTACVTLEEDHHGWFKSLVFTKFGGEFKLVIHTGLEDDPDSLSSTVLTSASRETRLQAVAALPKLYKMLLKEFEAEIERVNDSITEVRQLAGAIRTKAGK